MTVICSSYALPLHAQETADAPHPDSPGPDAPAAEDAEHDLAKQLNNPISSLISVPFQHNVDFGVGQNDSGVKSTLNIQPVVPFALSDDLSVIVRTILPVIEQSDVTAPASSQFGLGDVTQSFFFSPTPKPGGIIWGAGPVFLYPTGTNDALGTEKWGAGPTLVVLKQSGKNTFGVLANHIWSIGGDESRADISSTFLQPFFSHTTPKATTYGINLESTYDWRNEQWVIPVNLTVTQLTKVGKQPISVGGGFRYYAEKPAGGPDWGIRLIATLLFPK